MLLTLIGRAALLGATPGNPESCAAPPEPGASVERTLNPGEVHAFCVSLAAGQYFRAVVDQRGIDVVVTLSGPDGKTLAERDSNNGRFGPEPVSILAPSSGVHRLTVGSFEKDVVPGRYELRVEERRAGRPTDRVRVSAEKLFCEATALWSRGTGDSRRNGIEKAEGALRLWREVGDRSEQAATLLLRGDLQWSLGQSRQARESYDQVLELVRASHDQRGEARVLRAIGQCLWLTGESRRALDVVRDSARLASSAGDTQVQAGALAVLGSALWSVGEYERALETFEESLSISRAIKERATEAWALNGLGLTYGYLGEYQKALVHSNQAVDLLRALGNTRDEALALNTVGSIYFKAGRLDQAKACLQQVLDIKRATGDRQGEALALIALANVEVSLGNAGPALQGFNRALALSKAANDRQRHAWALDGIARVHALRGQSDEAIASFSRALAVKRQIDDRNGEAQTLAGIARVEQGRGRVVEARARIEAALGVIESAGARFHDPDVKVYYSATNHSLYEFYVDLLMQLHERQPSGGYDKLAFQASERGRARALVEALAEAAVEPSPPSPITLEGAQGLLDPGTALVSYEIVGDKIFAFVVGPRGFRAERLPAVPAELAQRIGNYVDLMARRESSALTDVSKRLYADLVGPWLPHLADPVKRLIVVPDGLLGYLPFETLLEPGVGSRYLVEDLSISYAPSATALARLQNSPESTGTQRRDLFLVADPAPDASGLGAGAVGAAVERRASAYTERGFRLDPIPFAAAEAKRVASYADRGSEVDIGPSATKARVKKAPLGQFRILHFAAHGLIQDRSASRSALVLAKGDGDDDGFLEAREIYRLKLSSDLVVLSACQTARGRILAGEGVQGLAQAFLHAGARSVVASLWSVQDERTATFMGSFYRHLAEGRPKGEALQAAKLEFLRDPKHAAPVSWAPFILIGDAQHTVPLTGRTPWYRWILDLGRALLLLGLTLVSVVVGTPRRGRPFFEN